MTSQSDSTSDYSTVGQFTGQIPIWLYKLSCKFSHSSLKHRVPLQLLTILMETFGIKIEQLTVKHGETIGMEEKSVEKP